MINWTGVFWQAERGGGSYVRAQLVKGGLRCGSNSKRGGGSYIGAGQVKKGVDHVDKKVKVINK